MPRLVDPYPLQSPVPTFSSSRGRAAVSAFQRGGVETARPDALRGRAHPRGDTRWDGRLRTFRATATPPRLSWAISRRRGSRGPPPASTLRFHQDGQFARTADTPGPPGRSRGGSSARSAPTSPSASALKVTLGVQPSSLALGSRRPSQVDLRRAPLGVDLDEDAVRVLGVAPISSTEPASPFHCAVMPTRAKATSQNSRRPSGTRPSKHEVVGARRAAP